MEHPKNRKIVRYRAARRLPRGGGRGARVPGLGSFPRGRLVRVIRAPPLNMCDHFSWVGCCFVVRLQAAQAGRWRFGIDQPRGPPASLIAVRALRAAQCVPAMPGRFPMVIGLCVVAGGASRRSRSRNRIIRKIPHVGLVLALGAYIVRRRCEVWMDRAIKALCCLTNNFGVRRGHDRARSECDGGWVIEKWS